MLNKIKRQLPKELTTIFIVMVLVLPSILMPLTVVNAKENVEPIYTASGSEGSQWGPEKAFDGNYNRYEDEDSRWASDATLATEEEPKWLQAEYPEAKTIEGFKIHWERTNVNAYSIQISNDGENFEAVYESNVNQKQWIESIKLEEPIKAKVVKLVITDFDENASTVEGPVSWPTVSVFEFEILEDMDSIVVGTDNVAEGKTATASNEENSDFTASNTVDGDLTTRWATDVSRDMETRTLDIDLHELTEIQSIIINWEREESNIIAFNLTYSEDGEQYFPYFEQTEKLNIQRQVLNLEHAVNARYLRLDVTEYDGGDNDWPNVGINEVEVYSEAKTGQPEEITSLSQISKLTIDEESEKLNLPKAKSGELSVAGSNAPPVIDTEGNVIAPLVDKDVKVTLELTKEEGSDETKEFTVPVKGTYSDEGTNEKPEVIPALQEWYGLEGSMTIDDSTSLVVDHSDFERAAEIFQKDLEEAENIGLSIQSADSNAIIFKEDEEGIYGEEGYGIEIDDGTIEIIAEEYTGAFYATRTLLQILKTNGTNEVSNGLIRDYPKYEIRGFMLDVGRKFTDLDYLYDYMKNMSYYKMNDFQIHLNDNELEMDLFDSIDDAIENAHAGFRMESDIVGENGVPLTSEDAYYTKDEFHQFISDASDYGMEIVPEFDTPGHALSMVKVHPELHYKGDIVNGKPPEEAAAMLDLSHPDTLPFIKSIYDEYLDGEEPVFQDSTIHIGSDEYYGGAEAYRAYVDDMLKFIRDEKNHTVRLWGSLSDKTGETSVTSEDVQLQVWNTGWADPNQMLNDGFDIINIDDGQVYIVPRAGYYFDRLNPETLFNNYEPNKFSNGAVVDESNPQFLGGMFALWNDKVGKLENGITQYDMFDRTFDAIPAIAQKTWGSDTDEASYEEFAEVAEKTGYAHNTNPTFDIETVDSTVFDYDFTDSTEDKSDNGFDVEEQVNAEVLQGEGLKLHGDESYVTTGLSELGPSATMDVTLTLENTEGVQIIAEKSNDSTHAERSYQDYATIYAVNEDGYVGYDFGNLSYSFDYKIEPGEETTLTFATNFEKTRLYVDGEEIPLLEETKMPYNTLVLPLEHIGSVTHSLNGIISSFNVEKGKYVDPSIINPDTMNISASNEELEQSDTSVEGPIELAFDGRLDTMWHTRWDKHPPLPVEVNLELEEETNLSKFVYTPRQSGDNGHIKQYRVEVSLDGSEYEEVASGTWEANSNSETIDLKGTTAKYVKFIAEDGVNGFASAAQFSLHKVLEPELDIPLEDVSGLKQLVDQFDEAGDFSSDQVVHALELHLKALAQFETVGKNKKVVKHLGGFKDLINYQKEQMSDEAYETLINAAKQLIEKFE